MARVHMQDTDSKILHVTSGVLDMGTTGDQQSRRNFQESWQPALWGTLLITWGSEDQGRPAQIKDEVSARSVFNLS